MLRFAANLSFQYTELPFLERFAAAAADGFTGVEYLFPYEWPAADLARQLRRYHLQQVLFNAPPGNWAAGERGLACLSGREMEFRNGIELACDYAGQLGCKRVHVMAGIAPQSIERSAIWEAYRNNLAWAADTAAETGIDILVEAINTRDMPGYLLNRQAEAHALLAALARPNLKVQMDLYHCQISDGDVTMQLRSYLKGDNRPVAHLQIASVPERHEPDCGELHYPHIFRVLEELGYDGWIGCEYRPLARTSEGLRWLRDYQGRI
jgi:2-dehydrotetronate isomerase